MSLPTTTTTTVEDVSFSDLEKKLGQIEEAKQKLEDFENWIGFCRRDPKRCSFNRRCEDCNEHIKHLRQEMHELYEDMGTLLKDARDLVPDDELNYYYYYYDYYYYF